jgi:high-affinity iron transporter
MMQNRGRVVLAAVFAGLWAGEFVGRAGADVSGVVRMPDICSPGVSPAVAYLVPVYDSGKTSTAAGGYSPARGVANGPASAAGLVLVNPQAVNTRQSPITSQQPSAANVALVNQQGLQFVPRVQAIALGERVVFGNADGETHNVHVVSPGFAFNQSMGPGQRREFVPERAGVMKLACDIHIHMRGFVVVSPTPWVQVCDRNGRFRLRNVPTGRYKLHVWHEMGDELVRALSVEGSSDLELSTLVLTARSDATGGGGAVRSRSASAPVRPWPEVIDRIGVLLASSRDAASRGGELAKARRLAEDAYWGEFEASDFETAVRTFLGYARAGQLERQFLAIRSLVAKAADARQSSTAFDDASRHLLADLLAAARELSAKGVTDRAHIDAAMGTMDPAASSAWTLGSHGDPRALLHTLKRGLHGVAEQADRDPESAASELTSVYMNDFEPVERYLMGRSPQAVPPLEIEWNALRGELFAGLKGQALTTRLDELYAQVEMVISRVEIQPAGTFGPAFVASLVTIVREGVEVILIIAMLLAIVSKAALAQPGQLDEHGPKACQCQSPAEVAARARTRASRAIWWGVAAAGLASLATALALNLLVTSASGAAREVLEGTVMLVASGVLFYVSYWLIAHAQAERWMNFLKRHARRGLELGGRGTLALTAFLAVYREGAETALMFQAILGTEGRARPGLIGVTAGLAVGLVILAAVAFIIRATSVRLPMSVFFRFSGLFLFALAVIFAGNGVFELQNAGILVTTNIDWLGRGFPALGLYPNVQVVSIQALLLAGAVLAWAVMPLLARSSPPVTRGAMSLATKRS